jgi:imidazoleglycerol phosphate dehydratase HisB
MEVSDKEMTTAREEARCLGCCSRCCVSGRTPTPLGAGRVHVATGAGLYDHFLEQLAFHGGLDLVLEGTGGTETGPHHTAEDAALTLGEALDRALDDRRGISR